MGLNLRNNIKALIKTSAFIFSIFLVLFLILLLFMQSFDGKYILDMVEEIRKYINC